MVEAISTEATVLGAMGEMGEAMMAAVEMEVEMEEEMAEVEIETSAEH